MGAIGAGSEQPSRTTVERDRSIDVLRGLLVVALVFVEWLLPGPGYAGLRHSPWDGVRVADFVFPGFLFVAGAAMAVGRPRSWARTARRLLLLVALGLVFNAFTTTSPLRFTGVLQMIGVSGFLATIVDRIGRRVDDVLLGAGALLVIHGATLRHAFEVDRSVFPDSRLYHQGVVGHDPEGVLNVVLGGTALVLFGVAAVRLRSWWYVVGLWVVTAMAWSVWAPNKRAWTPTFTLLMAASFASLLIVLRPVGTVPLLDRVGRNALLVYVVQHAVRELVEPVTSAPLELAFVATLVFCGSAALLDRIGVRLRV